MELLRNVFILSLFYFVSCQENAGTNVAPALEICYNTTRYVTRDYRFPATINVLVELIRKIEDAHPNFDARQLSIMLLHRFRQDGIRRTNKNVDESQGLPYSPKGWEAYKNRVQLIQITPGNAIAFNNNSISNMEGCSLHYMISSTVEVRARGDEGTVCGRLGRYTSRITKRQIELAESDHSWSSCPIESGVIYTKWGAVKAGLLIAGIASGFEPNPKRVDSVNLLSSYASTLAGELSEDAINQLSAIKSVGNGGGWNNTIVPKYYFLENNEKEKLYLTDAEIRGSLDGLYLSTNIQNWKSRASNLKVSQILDLYYSRGMFNTTAQACNRKQLTTDLIADSVLINQTYAYSILLDKESQLSYTLKIENLPTIVKSASDSFKQYLSNNLHDVECSAREETFERVSTDVLIFVDLSWSHQIIHQIISYVLENIDVNKYESSYTILNGVNGDVIVNKSRSILDYYDQFNLTQQQKYPTGFDYNKVIQVAERRFKAKLDNETDVTGQSTIILMIPHNTPSSSQADYIQSKRNTYKSILPDVRILVAGSGAKTSYNDLVTNPSSDIIVIAESEDASQIKDTGRSIVERFKKIPRSVVNPRCGSSFSADSTSFDIPQYVELSAINYHKISPNYFYEGQTLKIQGQGYGTITVCTSRVDPNPLANATGVNCQTLNSDEMSVDISNYCADDSVTECSPIYISVRGETTNIRCTEKTCRFPDSIKYTIHLDGVKCSSSNEIVLPSFLMILLLFMIMRF